MSRYLGLKKSYEDIKKRGATPTEKMLLTGLCIISRAYDLNFLEMRELREQTKKQYGEDFPRKVYNIKDEKKVALLWSIPKENRETAERYLEADYLEKQLYYISKTIRKGIGFDVVRRSLEADKNADIKMERREHEKSMKVSKERWKNK